MINILIMMRWRRNFSSLSPLNTLHFDLFVSKRSTPLDVSSSLFALKFFFSFIFSFACFAWECEELVAISKKSFMFCLTGDRFLEHEIHQKLSGTWSQFCKIYSRWSHISSILIPSSTFLISLQEIFSPKFVHKDRYNAWYVGYLAIGCTCLQC